MAKRDLAKTVEDRQLRARSPLYRWLHIHYQELNPVLSVKRPGWRAVLETVMDEGVLTTPLTPTAVRQAWLLVKRDMQAKADSAAPAVAPPASKTLLAAPNVAGPTAPQVRTPGAIDPHLPPPRVLRPVRLKSREPLKDDGQTE